VVKPITILPRLPLITVGAVTLDLTSDEAMALRDTLDMVLTEAHEPIHALPAFTDDVPLSESMARIQNTIHGRVPPGERGAA